MVATEKNLFRLTANDLMTPTVVVLKEREQLKNAAEELFKAGVHGAPVVNDAGECVGVLSVTDIARKALCPENPPTTRSRPCTFQESERIVRHRLVTVCTLPAGGCSFQDEATFDDGRYVRLCKEPSCAGVDWQLVRIEALPAEAVRHFMTTGPVTADLRMPIVELARKMLHSCVQRVIIVDAHRHPVGVVSVTDLVTAIAAMDDASHDD